MSKKRKTKEQKVKAVKRRELKTVSPTKPQQTTQSRVSVPLRKVHVEKKPETIQTTSVNIQSSVMEDLKTSLLASLMIGISTLILRVIIVNIFIV